MLFSEALEVYSRCSDMPEVRLVRCAPDWPERGPTYWEIQEAGSLSPPYQHLSSLGEDRRAAVRLITKANLAGRRFNTRRAAVEALAMAEGVHGE